MAITLAELPAIRDKATRLRAAFERATAGTQRDWVEKERKMLNSVHATFQDMVNAGRIELDAAARVLETNINSAIAVAEAIVKPPPPPPVPVPVPVAPPPPPRPPVPLPPAIAAITPTSFPIRPPVPKFRTYQEEAVETLSRARKGIAEVFTGGGKTSIAVEIIRRLKVPAVVLVHTQPLLQQWVRVLSDVGVSPVGQYYADVKLLAPVTVMTYQSAVMLPPETMRAFQLYVWDEVHHGAAPVWSKLLDFAREAPYSIGLSATVKPSAVTDVMPKVFVYTLGRAIGEKWVPPVEVIPVPVEMTAEEAEEFNANWETKRELYARYFRGMDMRQIAALMSTRTEIGRIAAAYVKAVNGNVRILAEMPAKREAVPNIIAKHPGEMVFLFTERIAGIEAVCKLLEARSVRCRTFHSELKPKERSTVLAEWGKTFLVLGTVRALDEGIDAPEASVAVIMASTRQIRQVIQRIGRVIRPRPGKIARIYVVYADGTEEHRVLDLARTAVRFD